MKNKLKSILSIALISAIGYTANSQELVITKKDKNAKTNGTADDIKDTGVVGVSGWSSFNKIAAAMSEMDGADYNKTQKIVASMRANVTTLETTRPEWMNTEEIKEDVADFQKDYNELISEKSTSEKEYRENLEEIAEQFEDMREEVNETYMAYAKINRQAYEEAKEEMKGKKGDALDAMEESNEEIEELGQVRDGSKASKKEAQRVKKNLKKNQEDRKEKAKKEKKEMEEKKDNM